MPNPSATMQMERNVDRLVRSLVGVVDYAAHWDRSGRIQRLEILRDVAVEEHQLVRNVVSGLGAGCGIRIPRNCVHVHAEPAAFRAASALIDEISRGRTAALAEARAAADAASASAPAGPAEPVAEQRNDTANGLANGSGNGSGNGAANGDSHSPGNGGSRLTGAVGDSVRAAPAAPAQGAPGSVPVSSATEDRLRRLRQSPATARREWSAEPAAASRQAAAGAVVAGSAVAGSAVAGRAITGRAAGGVPAGGGELRLEQLDLENRGATLRCRVVLVLGDNIYSAIAEVPASATAETDVAARVTLDALRAGALICATLDGVGFSTIGGRTWVVAAVRDSGSLTSRAGVAALNGSMGRAAAEAVLAALGPVTQAHQDAAALRFGGA